MTRIRLSSKQIMLCLGLLLIPVNSMHPSVFTSMDVADLKRDSESVVYGRVLDVSSSWNADRTRIHTYVTLDVQRTLHGRPQKSLTLRIPGGTVGLMRVEAVGAPQFEKGEEVVVFVSRWRDGAAMVTGYEQGKARVRRDALDNPVLEGGAMDKLPVTDLIRRLSRSDAR